MRSYRDRTRSTIKDKLQTLAVVFLPVRSVGCAFPMAVFLLRDTLHNVLLRVLFICSLWQATFEATAHF